jgi:hypothetical protein
MEAPRCPGRFLFHSSELTGGNTFAGFSGAAGAVVARSGAACTGSTEPAACCGADAGRLRGTGGSFGVTAADLAEGFGGAAGGIIAGGAAALGVMREPMIEPGGAMSKSSIG